jgi:archaellum biogenesis ATPase FlaH
MSSKKVWHKIFDLLYHYHHLDDIDLTNLLSTDLITHKITLKSNIKSANNNKQRRWSTHTEWWMRKIVTDDIKNDVYELIESANEWLSSWNVRVVIVDKVENLTSQNESRVIFDYFKIHEKLSDSFLKLFFKVHDNLFDSRHKIFFSTDLKHVYLIISMHSNDRSLLCIFHIRYWLDTAHACSARFEIS